ncbi:FISUMP domain-containing protein [uncultured Parabacteroides sp.]|uniref:FISUMP domain-containing protein n=1 Tax=uncultured Parabacteroides sp. TaxID=512312 RepID=UPI0028051C22|nr:FISUMP domain-containing protein [uncultured Parabacteroides sp.]
MNYKIALLPLLVAGMLASCNSDEEIIRTNPDYVEAGYGALTVTLTNPGKSLTKAGEELTDVATAEEKTIKSVAFFVQTGMETVDGEEMAGKFGAYFSTEEPLSANGLQEELAEVTAGNYTAKIRHQSDGWADPKVIVIANYAENGLTETLKNIQRWDDLANVRTLALAANPQTPLLMYATQKIGAWERNGGNGGGTAEATFELERLVSRIDIHNNAYVDGDESKGFVLTSARLVRSKLHSYLLPENASIGSVDVATEAFPTSGNVVVDNGIQKLDTLYAYENPNDEASKATAVQIDGTYRGGNISKIIALKKADGVGTIGDPIALARNTRYVININPAPDSTDIVWNIQVKEWAESDTIKVKPVFPVPAIEGVDASGITGSLSWDAASKTISTDGSATGTLSFHTEGTTASVYKVAYEYDTKGASIETDLVATPIVEAGTPVITYAAKVVTPFTINVPKQKDNQRVPMNIYVIIQNGGNEEACDTITIESRPNYFGTELKPVLMKNSTTGKNFFWAPVNVGATSMPTSVASTGDITETCGKIFQWGRQYGFPASDAAVDTVGIGTDLGRPTKDDLADMSKWNGKFIYRSDKNPNTQYNWLLINGVGQDNPAGSGMVADGWYQKLWNTGAEDTPVKSAYDPCPAGWRVPTLSEWKAIGAGGQIADSWDGTAKLMKIPGVDGSALVLPAAGHRSSATGASYNQGSDGNYWSSSVPSGNTHASNVNFNGATLYTNTGSRALGYSVRCVQE